MRRFTQYFTSLKRQKLFSAKSILSDRSYICNMKHSVIVFVNISELHKQSNELTDNVKQTMYCESCLFVFLRFLIDVRIIVAATTCGFCQQIRTINHVVYRDEWLCFSLYLEMFFLLYTLGLLYDEARLPIVNRRLRALH